MTRNQFYSKFPAEPWKDCRPFRGGMTPKGDLALLVALARAKNSSRVVEFGVHDGGTARVLLDNVGSITAYIGIDVPPGFETEVRSQQYEVPTNPGWLAQRDTKFSLMLCGEGSQGLRWIPEADLIYIDGDHSWNGVSNDSFLARQHIRKGGVIVWHDYPDQDGVREWIDLLNSRGDKVEHIDGSMVCFKEF